jgi:hypothetical protein
MKIANLREAAMEWTVTIEGPDEFGEIQRELSGLWGQAAIGISEGNPTGGSNRGPNPELSVPL